MIPARRRQAADTARISLAVMALAIAIGIVWLAWPRLRAGIAFLPVDKALANHWSGITPPADQLEALSSRARLAFRHSEHHRYLDAESLLTYLRAMDPALPDLQRRTWLSKSAESALASVSRAPMQPAAWLRIATVYDSLGRPDEEIAPPLLMSVYSGRVEPSLLLLRLEMLYGLQPSLDDDQRRMVTDQTLLAWRLQPRALVRSILSGDIAYERMAGLLVPAQGPVMDEIDEAIRAAAR